MAMNAYGGFSPAKSTSSFPKDAPQGTQSRRASDMFFGQANQQGQSFQDIYAGLPAGSPFSDVDPSNKDYYAGTGTTYNEQSNHAMNDPMLQALNLRDQRQAFGNLSPNPASAGNYGSMWQEAQQRAFAAGMAGKQEHARQTIPQMRQHGLNYQQQVTGVEQARAGQQLGLLGVADSIYGKENQKSLAAINALAGLYRPVPTSIGARGQAPGTPTFQYAKYSMLG